MLEEWEGGDVVGGEDDYIRFDRFYGVDLGVFGVGWVVREVGDVVGGDVCRERGNVEDV